MSKPTLNYFSICGRGELARLICAVGEVEFEDKAWAQERCRFLCTVT